MRQRNCDSNINHPDGETARSLVERTNQLSLEEFISNYIPDQLLKVETRSKSETDGAEERHDAPVDIYTGKSIPARDLEACFRLIEKTSAQDYANSSFGWSPSKKRREMKASDMKYLILRRAAVSAANSDRGASEGSKAGAAERVVGFLSFMVTYEGGNETIYCYEIHVSPALQGRGIGKSFMDRFEEIGTRIGLEKAMLGVFRSNERGRRFYERLGYAVDESSDQPRVLRNGTVKEPEYYMLSKTLQK